MRPMSGALLCLILVSISTTQAIKMDENINVYGEGGLYVRSNTVDGQDTASGIGTQDYSRSLSIDEDSSSLQSTYNYTNVSKNCLKKYNNYSNFYYVSGKSEINTAHEISIRSNQSIRSTAIVECDGGSFSTNYEISSNNSSLTEKVSEKDGAKNNYIAESRIDGQTLLLIQP